MTPGITFFISSTSDLFRERKAAKAVIKKLFHTAYDYLEDISPWISPEARLLRKIPDCEALLGILGADYGHQLPAGTSQIMSRLGKRWSPFYRPGQPCSIVEWEFHVALCSGLGMLPLLKRLAPEDYPDVRQREFIERVRAFRPGLWCKFFSDLDEFEQLVEQCVLLFDREQLSQWRSRARRSWTASIIALVALLIALVAEAGAQLGAWTLSRSRGVGYLLLVTIMCLVMVRLSRSKGN